LIRDSLLRSGSFGAQERDKGEILNIPVPVILPVLGKQIPNIKYGIANIKDKK